MRGYFILTLLIKPIIAFSQQKLPKKWNYFKRAVLEKSEIFFQKHLINLYGV